MSRRFLVKSCAWAMVVATAMSAAAPSAKTVRSRICVVAVHDSGLFTMCPPAGLIKDWRYPGRTQSLEMIRNPNGPRLAVPQHLIQLDRPALDRSRAGWWDIIGKTPGSCPSGKIDLDLKKGLESQFSQRTDYQLVDTPGQADLVFLAEGIYADAYAGFVGVQSGRYRSTGHRMLALVMAAVVPADAYLRDPADSELILENELWEGAEAWTSDPPGIDRQPAAEAASLSQLAGQFIDRKYPSGSFPRLCAPGVLVPLVDGQGMPRQRAALEKGSGGQPTLAPDDRNVPTRDNIIRVSVSLVTVPTVVSDAAGSHVPELSTQDFHVFENDVEQKIDRVIPEVTPFNVVLMLDTSGSTIFEHSEIQNAALAFVEALRPEDRVMVVSFDSYIYLDSGFTGDRPALRRAILRADTGAGTRLYDALDLVLTECLKPIQGRKAIVLFTDGIDSQSWLAPFGAYQDKVEESDALVYAVQYDSAPTSFAARYLKGLSENSGGRLFSAASIANLREAFSGIADELQHQYTICYYPSNQANDSAFRRIRVTVDRPGTRIRARAGYRIAAR